MRKYSFAYSFLILFVSGCEDSANLEKYTRKRVPVGVSQSAVLQIERNKQKIAARRILYDKDAPCPPESFKLTNGDTVRLLDATRATASVWESFHSVDKKYSVHLFTSRVRGFKRVHSAKASLMVAGGLKGFMIKQFEIDHSTDILSESCSQISLVTSFSADSDLSKAIGFIPAEKVMLVASRVIQILRALHSLGQVAGSIDLNSFTFKHLNNIENELILTDFRLIKPFVDFRSGYHIFPNIDTEITSSIDKTISIKSPRESEGRRVSRADDMIHAAEVFFIILGFLPDQYLDNSRDSAHPTFIEFNKEMRDLSFYARPDYEKWIKRFESDAVTV